MKRAGIAAQGFLASLRQDYVKSFEAAPGAHIVAWILAAFLFGALRQDHEMQAEHARLCTLIEVFELERVAPYSVQTQIDGLCTPFDSDPDTH